MITGLHIELSSEELKQHIQERADHHKKRAEWYSQQAAQLQEGQEPRQPDPDEDHHSRSYDPLQGLLTKVNEHRYKMVFFRFLADHIIPNEKYRLSESDLARLEIFSRYL